MSDINKHVGVYILLARRSQNLTQLKLSKMSKVSRVTICYIESRKGNPNFDSVYKLIEALGKTLNDLDRFIGQQRMTEVSMSYLPKSEFISEKLLGGIN